MQTMQSNNAVALSQYSQASQLSQSRKRLHYMMGMTEPISAATFMHMIKRNKRHDEYKRLLRNPEHCCANHKFDDVLSLTRRFHIIEPIVSKNASDDIALTNVLGVLRKCGLGQIDINNLKKMGHEGLVHCHCHTYLANARCKHACAFAFDRQIITTFAKTMHPKPSIKNRASGRNKHAKHGGNLDIH